ncbi:sulfotransferase family 2 domain-containing protein [Symmachiella dynata]|uniref:sulfotransferase family 2 domain-containing protein n=1 Tax=Symmachiella dynata TaxID=2527995 RepID=UPI0030ED6C1D|tara:strand:+ start:583 stop:1323 length:741 start_codon:yes stop_codon:yes gene_type:complete
MISHEHKAIYVHVPKCAGSSVEKLLLPNRPQHDGPDYEHLFGWCPKRKIHLQHATATQMLDLELVTESQWRDYYKFAFVRNPFDRTFSDYFWMKTQIEPAGGFGEYIERRGRFAPILGEPDGPDYRGDHLIPQCEFVYIDGKIAVDFIGRFESLDAGLETIQTKLSVVDRRVPHLKKGRKRHQHYSHFYTNRMREQVRSLYEADLEAFGYQFDDQRSVMSNIKRYVWPIRHTLGNWKYAAQTRFGV